MKYFIILFGFLILQSCVKEDNLETPKESKVDLGYKHSKKIDVFDTEGNSAVVQISSNDFQDVNSITAEDLEFTVTTQKFSRSSNSETKVYNEKQPVDKNFDNIIFVDIIETDLNDEITGYWVQVKEQPDIGNRSIKAFAYGSTGVRGIWAKLTHESKSKCHVDIDLDVLEDGNSIFYSNLADFRLRDLNEENEFCSPTKFYKYRAKFSTGGCLFGETTTDYLWLIGCN